jgi:sugar lactone lactonase YvrE
MWSQTAPSISYSTPQNYVLNAAITTLAPVNSGGSVPALNYKQVSLFAGNITGFLDATGTEAMMKWPQGIVIDADGTIYFADSWNQRIRKVTPAGVVTTIAGDGYFWAWNGRLLNSANGRTASFDYPIGLVLDSANNCLYVADYDNDCIRKVSLTGTYEVTTFAGSGASSSVDGTGTGATFNKPFGIAMDPSNTYLYVTDKMGNKIRRITISNKQVVTIAGTGEAGTNDSTSGGSATFNEPGGIVVDANFIYVTDVLGHKVRKIAKTFPYAVTTFAGSGVSGATDGIGIAASFASPTGLTLDGAGNLFVTEWSNKIRKITPNREVTIIAGNEVEGQIDGNGTAASLSAPLAIAINKNTGIAYFTEWGNGVIRKIELFGGYTISPPLPAGLSFDNTTGVITGTPTATNNGPISYAVTGTNYYGTSTATVIITTGSVSALTTTAPNTITSTTAKSGGTITSNGGSAIITSGICWSTDLNPTISDSKTTNGALSGAFTGTMTGLTAYTYYHVRAYATNSIGTTYGSDVIFRTLIAPPNISYPISGIFTINSPLMGLNGTNTGGFTSGITSSVVSTLAGSTAGSVNGSGTAAQFNNPYGVATDATGNVYVVDQNNNAIRKITPAGLVSTLAGGDGPGYNDGFGISAKFNGPKGIATDALGNIYVGDTGNHRIRKIDVLGNVTTIAGSGTVGSTAGFTDGAGTLAKFNSPCGITIDASGNIYVADYSNYRIRKIDASGNVTTIAGNGLSGFDDGIGALAKFSAPFGITLDVSNNIYVTDSNIIRKITSAGIVSTIAGSIIGTNDGEATLAQFNYPFGITTDLSGNVYVADTYNNRIRKISTAGIVSTLAGNAVGSTDGVGTNAKFSQPTGIAFDSNRNLFVADLLNNKIRKITNSEGFSISPALPAGLTIGAYGFISGTPTVASVATNYTVTATNAGGISSFVISIKVIAVPKVSTTFYNTITQTTVNVGGNVTSDEGDTVTARGVCWNTSTNPTIGNSITTDGAGIGTFTSAITGLTPSTLYYVRTYATNSVGTTYGNQIRFYTRAAAPNISYSGPQTYTKNITIETLTPSNTGGDAQNSGVTTLAGSCDVSGAANGQGVAATFNSPNAVAVSSNRDVYVSDSFNNKIRKITAAGIVSDFVSVVSPKGIAVDSFENVYVSDGSTVKKYAPNGTFTTIAEVVNLMTPMGLAVDAFDNVYVADKGHATIYKISSTGIISIVAGSGIGLRGSTDGLASTATFNAPTGVTVDASGTIYVADFDNYRIRKITTDGMVSTLAGSSNGFQNGTGSQAEFHSLDGITVDTFGNVYVADNGSSIRKITPQGVVTTFTGIYGGAGGHCINGPLEAAFFHAPRGLTIDDMGTLFATDFLSHTIRKIVPNGYTVSPALPAGLVLNADGSITGTPEVGSVATDYTITANNNGGSSATTITITVLAPNTLAVVSTISSTSITTNSGTITVIVSSDGGATVTARGVCWSTATNPTIADDKTTDGTGIGNFSSAMTSLLPNTTYYIRSYATNSVGTKYGNQLSFTTVALVLPSLSSTVVTAITSTTALSGGTITSDGGSAILTSGICWSTTSNPTISDSKTTDGTGTGTFTSAITGLSPLTTYYVRAYATNSAGTAYGNEISFVTFDLPVVVTIGPTTTGFPVITYTSAQCGGSIQSLGGSTQITKGIYYSESPTPTAINTISTIQTSGSTPLLYDTLLSNLKPNTTYYVRAYVSNEAGTGLGEIVSFTTRPLLFTVSGMNESDFGEGYTKIVVGGNINNISLYSNLYFEPTAYGVCWSTNANSNPTITDAFTIIGATTDESLEEPGQTYLNFERQLTGLTPNTTYYARSFAKNATEVTYGTLYSFDSFIGKPILTSTSANITSCSADLGGLISDASGGVMGIKGVIYSTNQQTIINAISANTGIGGVSSITSTGIGAFSLNKSNLLPNTTYYYKAYAFGSSPSIENIKFGWGDVKSFTTLAAVIPTIALSTVSVSTSGTIAASSLGSSSSCGAPITECGFCYSTSINPTVLNDKISLYTTGVSIDNFLIGANLFLEITNYNPSQTYYVRSYAINAGGIAYSNNWILAIVAPSNLTVSQSIVSGTVGVTMSSITVSNSGGVATSYSISPSLPNGLLFDTLLGTISGTPLALLDPTTFTITATNSAGSTSTTVSLTINNSVPTNLTSSQSSLLAVLGTMIVPITMSNSGGIVTSYTISPMLPAGLTLNGTTGTISGTPTALLSLTNYTITATNSIGSTTTIIGISVKDEKVWTGTISTAWNNASNWSNNAVPTSSDNVIINTSSPNAPTLNVTYTVGSGRTLTIGNTGTLNVAPNASLTIAGTADFGSKLVTFKSDAAGTGVLGTITGSLTNADNVTTERYIPALRAFRFLTSSVTTTTSIEANWQEGVNNSSVLYANNMNPKPGFGTHITGSSTGSNGFDATQTTNASLFGFNNSTGQWTTIANTDTNLLNAGTAYRLMVRGDRSIDLNNNAPTPTPTTLRATGTLFIGPKTLSGAALNQVANGYSLIGNPYQAPVDMKAVLDSAIGLVTQYCYVWEPRQNTRGAYVSVGVQTGVNSINGSFATKYLQPGQAAFIRKDANANGASLTFSEADKYLTTNESVFHQETSNLSLLKVSMHSNGTSLDGLAIVFDTNSNNEIDANDAGKLANLDEDIATSNNGSLSSIESRQFPVNNEEIQLYANKFRATNYTLKTTLENYSGPTPYLLDTYTQNYTLLDGNLETIYPFSVDSTVPNSVATNRFKIVFSNAALNTTDFEKGCYLYPNPSTDSAFYVHLNGLNSSTKVTLFNTLGQQIQLNVNTTENNSYFCKTTFKLPTGTYIVVIEQDGKKATKKWMVQ